jgi:hypothetical protein
MATRPLRMGRGPLMLCVGALLAAGVGGAPQPPTVKKVTVGPTPCKLDPPGEVHLSRKNGDQIQWEPQNRVSIVFKRRGFPPNVDKPPLQDMKDKGNGEWEVAAPSRPNSINLGLPTVPKGGFRYEYDQFLDGKGCDGIIIIDP